MRIGVFGLGLTGLEVTALAERLGWRVAGFSRARSLGDGRRFDASREGDCRALEREELCFDAAVATFPPEGAWPGFWKILANVSRNSVLLGTTGSYLREGRSPVITEATAVKPDHPRRPAEESFVASGGVLLRLSGIYGGPRNPLRWIEQGRVGYERRQVNLVHCGDIAAAVAAVFMRKPKSGLYNVSDGQRHTWRQIIDHLVESGRLRHDRVPILPKRIDSFVENRRFVGEYPDFRFRDFWTELDGLADEWNATPAKTRT